ncbi:alanine racemase [Coraliomargarita sinensis]|nr:alanine racemase [Coraliomargarita sinensis]
MTAPNSAPLEKPRFTVDLDKVRRNIAGMADKFQRHGVGFRPHFKTHQCAAIGELFRKVGVSAITVSSLDMASYFHQSGWDDITLAVPVNPGQLEAINRLAGQTRLNLLVDSLETTRQLNDSLDVSCPVWVKVDVGYGRVGIRWHKQQAILDLIEWIDKAPRLELLGLLTHSGHSYGCRGRGEVAACFEEGRLRMLELKRFLQDHGHEVKVSMGDTPSASLAEQFEGVDEMRPGNFVFYDLFQSQVGSCGLEDIAVATACPVIGKYEDELKLVVYGGSIHLSKDSVHIDGERLFGQLALPDGKGWAIVPLQEGKLTSCCQEVSKIQVSPGVFEQIELGQCVYILPVHSCLAADLYPRYATLDGDLLERFRLFS